MGHAFESQKDHSELSKIKDLIDAYDTGGAYGYERELYKQQLEELKLQREKEEAKKKTDQSKILDYDNQISEMEDKITTFSESIAESVYDINIKDWAAQLGDSLFNAWKKGEDGATAFKQTASDIIGQVVNSWEKVNIIEPALSKLQTYLFGSDGQGGAYGKDFSLSQSELQTVATMLNAVSDKTTTYESMLDQINQFLVANGYNSLKSNGSSNNTSNSIETIKETTADLGVSYLNSTRADVSKQLIYIKKNVEEQYPQINALLTSQLTQLLALNKTMQANLDMVTSIKGIFDDITLGNKKVWLH